MKVVVSHVNATPTKRLYLSIIADYDLNKAVCELVDNAIDIWIIGRRKKSLSVKVRLDVGYNRILWVDRE